MKRNLSTKQIIMKACMAIFDIFAVNFAYWFALIVRFYIAFEFKAGADRYIPVFLRIAPFYTVICIIVFALFRLYDTVWKNAGIRDLYRVVGANIVTGLLYAILTLMPGCRMPLTIYFIGFAFQLLLIAMSRFGITFILTERDQIRMKKTANVNAMIIGMEYIARSARGRVDHSGTMMTRCMVDPNAMDGGQMSDGVPVIAGISAMREAIEKYKITYVMVADAFLTDEQWKEINTVCTEKDIELVDVTGYLDTGKDPLSLLNLLRVTNGPVILAVNGNEIRTQGGEDAMQHIKKRSIVKSISVKNGTLRIEVTDNPLVDGAYNGWIDEYKEQTGDDVSYF